MKYLNPAWNRPDAFEKNREAELDDNVAIPLAEIELVRRLARRVPELDRLGPRVDEMLRRMYSDFWAGDLWTDYRSAIVHRAVGLRAPLLRATDRLANHVTAAFTSGLGSGASLAFDPGAYVLVGEGRGNPGDYAAWAGDGNGGTLPFALIKMPEAAFWSAQRWMAIPHEVAHALFVGVDGLAAELEDALEDRMRRAVTSGEIKPPGMAFTLPDGRRIEHAAEDLLALVWRTWADEAQADVVGVLACGGAAVAEGQVVLGFSNQDWWEVDAQGDRPESHPTDFVRQWMQIAALRRMGGHDAIADELAERLRLVGGGPKEIVFFHWTSDDTAIEAYRGDIEPWLRSAELAAELLLERRMARLGDKSYSQVLRFDAADQRIADEATQELLEARTDFGRSANAAPRHVLAAAVWAHERDPDATATFTEILQHFLL